MLPILFKLTIPTSLGVVAWIAASIASGLLQYRTARLAGDSSSTAWKACAAWTVGTAGVLAVLVKALADQNILRLTSPLPIPIPTYGLFVAGGFLVAMQMAARAAERSGLSRDKVLD